MSAKFTASSENSSAEHYPDKNRILWMTDSVCMSFKSELISAAASITDVQLSIGR